MECEIPSIYVFFAGKNWKASCDYRQAIAIARHCLRVWELDKSAAEMTLAEAKEKAELLSAIINLALINNYQNLNRNDLECLITLDESYDITQKILTMLLCAYSDRPEERDLKGCTPHLKLLKKEIHHG